jgi:hypothetical protein
MLTFDLVTSAVCGNGSENSINWWFKDSTGDVITDLELSYGYTGTKVYFAWDGDYVSTNCSLRFSYVNTFNTASGGYYDFSSEFYLDSDASNNDDTVETEGAE